MEHSDYEKHSDPTPAERCAAQSAPRGAGVSVWYCIPSARPAAEAEACLSKWRAQGYKIALYCDKSSEVEADECLIGEYPGYSRAVNRLIRLVLQHHPETDWLVTGGDDVHPDMAHAADEIAAQCGAHFGKVGIEGIGYVPTFGVMQPTGDRWGDDVYARARWPDAPAMIDRIAGSPWIGREFARRINQGRGPLWPEYFHNWADQELQELATKLGIFWQRRDLTHYHHHCCRLPGGTWAPHLKHADADYKRMKPVFEARQKAGFPGSEPLP